MMTDLIVNNALINNIKSAYTEFPSTFNGLIPVGGIINVHYDFDFFLHGYVLCDGSAIPAGCAISGNTPDLSSGKFLQGSTTSGLIGGAESIGIPLANHTHDYTASTSSNAHTHGLNNSYVGVSTHHTHDSGDMRAAFGATFGHWSYIGYTAIGAYRSYADYTHTFPTWSNSSSAYSHHTPLGGVTYGTTPYSITMYINTHTSHPHTISNVTYTKGSGSAVALNPSFISFKFIMRVK
jgi:hypothetical protein